MESSESKERADALHKEQQRLIVERMEGRPCSDYEIVSKEIKEETRQAWIDLVR